jgi:predicted nuclease of predicted toxin-antitoxin system
MRCWQGILNYTEKIFKQPFYMQRHRLTTPKSELLVAEIYKLYLDQMFHLDVAEALIREGYDTIRAAETGHSRSDDQQILDRAIAENRILVTLDEHFGDWVVLPLSKHPGVIRIKVNPTTSKNVLKILLPCLRRYTASQFENHLVIISAKRSKWILTA